MSQNGYEANGIMSRNEQIRQLNQLLDDRERLLSRLEQAVKIFDLQKWQREAKILRDLIKEVTDNAQN